MAHDTRLHNSDDSAVFASRYGRRFRTFKSDWFQYPPCTEEQAERLIQYYRRHGYEIKKAFSLDYRRWTTSVRLPYSGRSPRPSRTSQQRIWR